MTASAAGLVGAGSVGLATASLRDEEGSGPSVPLSDVGPMVDLRRFGAVADGTTDLGPAVERAVAAYSGTRCALVLPVTRPGEFYHLRTSATIDQPEISLVGNGAGVQVATDAALHFGTTTRAITANARVSGIRFFRDGAARGVGIASDSRFLVVHRVRNLVIDQCQFLGSDVAIHLQPGADSDTHDCAFNHIVGQNRFEEINFAVKGEYDPDSPGGWLSIADLFITGAVINRAYVSGIHLDAVDGLLINECDFVNVGSRSLDEPRVADKRNNVFVGRSDWVHIMDNQLYESGLEALRLDEVRQAKITGNLIAWPGQLDLRDAIHMTGFPDFPARAVVSDNVIVYYTASAVAVSGQFASLAIGSNAVSYSSANDRYVGPQVRGDDARSLDAIAHYRYDLGEVSGLGAAQLSIAGTSSHRPGESDRLPGHLYLVAADKATAISGTSSALRDLDISGAAPVFPLSDIDGNEEAYGGTILIVAKAGFDPDSRAGQYLLMVAHPGETCIVLGRAGDVDGESERSPAFDWSVEANRLIATPRRESRGRFVFSAQTSGNLIVG